MSYIIVTWNSDARTKDRTLIYWWARIANQSYSRIFYVYLDGQISAVITREQLTYKPIERCQFADLTNNLPKKTRFHRMWNLYIVRTHNWYCHCFIPHSVSHRCSKCRGILNLLVYEPKIQFREVARIVKFDWDNLGQIWRKEFFLGLFRLCRIFRDIVICIRKE